MDIEKKNMIVKILKLMDRYQISLVELIKESDVKERTAIPQEDVRGLAIV